ncbi:MAG: hypothetical protein A2017_07285 [Lentisphaerae bacterium GWF2_44_16]|nr:MAG: hypothetical protein A2017_07285 [Lentisphaerae bacterium GWF2_44_16]
MPAKKFTLIELLIVISIIAILAGMLLPALKKAREQGYSILCKSNLKQVGTAFLNYSTDFNENTMYRNAPYVEFWSGDYADRPWYELLGLLGKYSQLDYGVKIGTLRNKGNYYGRNILCPAQKSMDYSYSDYMANQWFLGTISTSDAYKNHSFKMMQAPTQIVLVTDNGKEDTHSVTYASNIRSNHVGNTANFLFGDMHVSHMSREKIGLDATILIQGF